MYLKETKPPASNEATSIIKQDPQKPPAAQDGSPSENKAGAEQKKPHSESTKSAGLGKTFMCRYIKIFWVRLVIADGR